MRPDLEGKTKEKVLGTQLSDRVPASHMEKSTLGLKTKQKQGESCTSRCLGSPLAPFVSSGRDGVRNLGKKPA